MTYSAARTSSSNRPSAAAPDPSPTAPPLDRPTDRQPSQPSAPTVAAPDDPAFDDPASGRRIQSERAARLMELLGLTDDELCAVLEVDALTLLSGQLDHRAELPILLDLLADAEERAGPVVLRRWVRAGGPAGRRPLDLSKVATGRWGREAEDLQEFV